MKIKFMLVEFLERASKIRQKFKAKREKSDRIIIQDGDDASS